MPGYVFFEMDASQVDLPSSLGDDRYQRLQPIDASLLDFSRSAHVLKLLRYANDGWRLQGADDAFVQTLFSVEGNIDISQARFDEGDRIRILSGFLKDYEGCITRVNRKARTVEVSMNFNDKNLRMCLGYELVVNANG
jgi:transcription antitermination factor NusG